MIMVARSEDGKKASIFDESDNTCEWVDVGDLVAIVSELEKYGDDYLNPLYLIPVDNCTFGYDECVLNLIDEGSIESDENAEDGIFFSVNGKRFGMRCIGYVEEGITLKYEDFEAKTPDTGALCVFSNGVFTVVPEDLLEFVVGDYIDITSLSIIE